MRWWSWLFWWGPAAVYMALVFWLSHQEAPPDVGPDTPAHFVEYGILAALLVRGLCRGWIEVGAGAALRAAGFAFLFGVTDELHQALVPPRQASLLDLGLDGLGAAAAVALLWVTSRIRLRPAEEGKGEWQSGSR